MFIRPKKPPQDIPFSKKLLAEMDDLEKKSVSGFCDKYGALPEDFEISYTGGYPIALNDEATTRRDVKVTVLTSFLGILILFGLSFRTWRVLFYVGLPLAVSLVWTLGFAGITFHRLSILTCVFSCVLIGLGIDFAIHIVNRYYGRDNSGLDVPERLQKTFREAGMGIIIGGITTAVAFYSVGLSDFTGFRELGILTGTGILFCLVAMIFVLPSLLVLFSKGKSPKTGFGIAGFGLNLLLNRVLRHPWAVLIVGSIIVCSLAFLGLGINFDDNLKNFRPDDDRILKLQERVTGWLGASTGEILLVAKGKSEAEVMETNALIYNVLEELRRSEKVAGIRSISRYFLAPGEQKKNREFIQKHPDAFDIRRIKMSFNDALEKNGFETLDLYDGYFESLSRALVTDKVILPSSLQGEELDRLLKLFFFKEGGYHKVVTYINPPGDLWSRADTNRFTDMIVQKLEEKGIKGDSYVLTGIIPLTGDLKALIIKNLKSSIWFAGLSIVLVLLIYYRNVKLLMLSILPLIIGLAILSGIMVILRIDFNFFNLIVVPMIVGIGIDDGIHFTNTFRQVDHADMPERLSKTGRAAVLTSLTTIVGFGSIALSHYPGLRSMGYVAVIGISACLFASIVVLPAVFAVIRNLETEKPAL